jgi:chloride channel protein, CIC family
VTGRVKAAASTRWVPAFEMLLLAIGTGLASSCACVALRLFFKLLQGVLTGHFGLLPDTAAQLPLWRRAVTPVTGAAIAFLIAWLYQRCASARKSQEYVEAVRLNDGRIAFAPTFWRTLSSAFSVATGAAIGREGSMIQFAAGVTSWFGQRIRSTVPLPRLVSWGVAAAVAAVYQAPIAGAFFAAEIVTGSIALSELPLLLASAFTGTFISGAFLGAGPLFRAPGAFHIQLSEIWLVLLLSILMGALGPAYYWLIRSMRLARRLPVALLWSGALVGALSLFHTEVWGNGDVALSQIMQVPIAVQTALVILALRLLATVFCVATGTVGGVFTPTLFAGSAVGLLFGHLLHAPSPLLFAMLGMGCLLAAVTHAPWMAAFMAAELTGHLFLLPLFLPCCVLAGQLSKRLSPHSLYALATPEPIDDLPSDKEPVSVRAASDFGTRVAHTEVA